MIIISTEKQPNRKKRKKLSTSDCDLYKWVTCLFSQGHRKQEKMVNVNNTIKLPNDIMVLKNSKINTFISRGGQKTSHIISIKDDCKKFGPLLVTCK